ncbi:COX15/CtaA family protein [Rubellicoccus peritrichatus]|uniref:COX15/CtaA family protein n=1 Tax=Rubellicoccus peritrichatus TaxID=3080537 RepID=A0AAQ3L765_9BACT|nr:COX15/CtaA family protein [Puniceicoccus sp. CR14]WOO40281.1 COX15/CtaA family protein [Puniceicoccus sp. CR14]
MRIRNRTTNYKPLFFAFSVFAMLWVTLLLYAGAYTTSIQAGMAFLDWPLSNSSVNPDGWLTNEDMRAEHSHRLLGAKLGMLAIAMVIWTQLREARVGVRRLAITILVVIVLQGLLGGMRVLFDQLNTGWDHNIVARTFAVFHACGAQITVCMLVAMAAINSRAWIERQAGLKAPVSQNIRRWGYASVAVLFVQIILGAVMRHSGAGLAIPTFPLTPDGSIFPAFWNFPITINWLHRAGAVAATIVLVIFVGKILGSSITRKPLGWLGWTVCALLVIQIFLGAATIWTHKNPVMASNHMVVGAFLLGSTWLLTLLTLRIPVSVSVVQKGADSVGKKQQDSSFGQPAKT